MIRRGLPILLALVVAAAAVAFLLIRQRQASCAYIPLIGEELLPNAALSFSPGSSMPTGWARAADGVELRGKTISDNPDKQGFDLDGDGRALQFIGIANEVRTPAVRVAPGQSYCFLGRALTDSEKGSATRLRAVFDWQDATGKSLGEITSVWQQVALWTKSQPSDWSFIRAAATAPTGASQLVVSIHASSDDRVYLDGMHIRNGAGESNVAQNVPSASTSSMLMPWPNGAKAALSFSFDWETEMGGLIHSRSVDDPNADKDPADRAMRMREGITTTLDIFRPYGIRATYYATGYNFLLGNRERRVFMGNPTYTWANKQHGWSDAWKTTPWFSLDPFRTAADAPGWYFGDLVPRLQAEKQDIQSHTFAHFAGTFVGKADWQADFDAWHAVAGERGVAPARSLAFPWSSSNGMSDDDWNMLAQNGISSVTRTYWAQPKSALFPREARSAFGLVSDPRCRPVPGHESILACPDFYLTETSAPTATMMIDRAIAANGMIDLWAHTEEVTSAGQIAAWTNVVRYAAAKRDAGDVWIAPLREIADWQQALQNVKIQKSEVKNQDDRSKILFTVTNESAMNLEGVTLRMPTNVKHVMVDGKEVPIVNAALCMVHVPAQRTIEVSAWPA